MEQKILLRFLKRSLLFLGCITGGFQIVFYSLEVLIRGSSGFHNIESYFFNLEFIPENILSFWSIYFVLFLIIVGLEKFPFEKPLFLDPSWLSTILKNYSEQFFMLLSPLLLLFIDSSTRFTISLIVYFFRKDFVSLNRLFTFSDGFISWYIKSWIISFIVICFFTRYLYVKSLKNGSAEGKADKGLSQA